jgi:hypothetical protein
MSTEADTTTHAPTPLPLQPSVAPKTTAQEDMTTAGQRKINLIWEVTQSVIAVGVVFSAMAVGVHIGFNGGKDDSLPTILSTGFGMIVGFYFARTNHAAIGGVGSKPNPQYEGR